MRISVAIARATVAAARHQGVEPARLFARADLEAGRLDEGHALLPVDDYHRLVRAALALTGDPALGLRVGALAPLGMLHVVGHVLASCRTLRDAHHQFMRFSSLVEPGARYQLVESGAHGHFVYAPAHAPDLVLARFHAEVCLLFTYQLCRQLLFVAGGATGVCFATPAPPYADEVARVFGCPVSYGQPEHQLVFPRLVLDEALVHADAEVFDRVRGRAEELLAGGADEDVVAQVVRLLRWEPRLGRVSEAVVATRLRVAARTLRRRLAAAGQPFSRLLDEVRKDRACTALARPGTSVKELAEELGFSEPSALHRAFKRWTGASIGAWPGRARAHSMIGPQASPRTDGS